MTQYLVSTDLDGTLLDHHSYSWEAALPAIHKCSELSVPVVFNTSKTAEEALELQKRVGVSGPIIVENGSALRFGIDTFEALGNESIESLTSQPNGPSIEIKGSIVECVFGAPRDRLIEFIQQVRQDQGWQFEGFNDWNLDQIVSRTGLSLEDASKASNKHYSEPLVWNDSEQNLAEFIQLAEASGYSVLKGGRFYHLQGKTNKAVPLTWIKEQGLHLHGAGSGISGESKANDEIKLICLGDNHNDIDMLNIADFPVCVRSPVAGFPELSTDKEIIYTEGEGPVGWNEAVLKILQIESS